MYYFSAYSAEDVTRFVNNKDLGEVKNRNHLARNRAPVMEL